MSETKRRKNPTGSHASLGGTSLRDEIEMHNRSRPTSGLLFVWTIFPDS